MAQEAGMHILVTGSRSGADDWLRAQRAPVERLPRLSEAQKSAAEHMGIPADDYARSVLAGELSRSELSAKAEAAAGVVQRLLAELRPGAVVEEVVFDTFSGWYQIKARVGGRSFTVRVEEEMIDRLLASGSEALEQQLRRMFLLHVPSSGQTVSG